MYFLQSKSKTSAVVDKPFVDKIDDKTAILRKYDISTKILFCRHNNVPFWKRNYSFKKQNIDKISLLWLLAKSAASECLMLSQPLFTRPVPMIHRVNQSLDFGWNITAFISWPLFCRQMSPSGWNLTRHVDREISSTTALSKTCSRLNRVNKENDIFFNLELIYLAARKQATYELAIREAVALKVVSLICKTLWCPHKEVHCYHRINNPRKTD